MVILRDGFAVVQAPELDGLSFDPFSCQQDSLAPTEIDIGGGEVAQAFVIAPMIVVGDEGIDLGLKVAGQAGISSRAECGSLASGASARSRPGASGSSNIERGFFSTRIKTAAAIAAAVSVELRDLFTTRSPTDQKDRRQELSHVILELVDEGDDDALQAISEVVNSIGRGSP